MTNPETESAITVLCKGGSYYFNQNSNVMIIMNDFNRVIDKEPRLVYIACVKAKVNLVMYPAKLTDVKNSPLMELVKWFLRLNLLPSFLLVTKILASLFISDDAIYLGKNYILDKENLIDRIVSGDKDWLYVKNDEQSDDQLTKLLNNEIKRERGLLSTTMVLGKNGIKNMGRLFSDLGK